LELEKDTIKLSQAKREVLFRKMNKLASQGLRDMNKKPGQEEPVFPTTPQERIEKEIQFGRYKELKQKQHAQMVHNREMTTPITQEEYLNLFVKHHNEKVHKAKEEVSYIFEEAGKAGITVQRQDAYEDFYEEEEPEMTIYDLAKQDVK